MAVIGDHAAVSKHLKRSSTCVKNDRNWNSEIIYNDPKTTATPDRGQLLHTDEALCRPAEV